MDQTTLKLIARFKHISHKQGIPIDVVRFAADRNYARWALTKFTATGDEEEVLLALQIMSRLRLTAPVPTPSRERNAKVPVEVATVLPAPTIGHSAPSSKTLF